MRTQNGNTWTTMRGGRSWMNGEVMRRRLMALRMLCNHPDLLKLFGWTFLMTLNRKPDHNTLPISDQVEH